MDTAVSTPVQLVVNIEDASMLKDIKRTIAMIKGVISVDKSNAMKSYERAKADVKSGQVIKCKDKAEFFNQLGL